MDAKPQRPFRPLRVRDENQQLSTGPEKVIHQRHKSSPAISAMMQPGLFRNTTSRTALADVSSFARNQMSKDDTAVTIKPVLEDVKENVQLQTGKEQQPLSKPAQRPLSISGIKGIVLNALSSQSTSKQPLEEKRAEVPLQNTLNPRKTLTKKANFIYREDILPQEPLSDPLIAQPPTLSAEKPSSSHGLEPAAPTLPTDTTVIDQEVREDGVPQQQPDPVPSAPSVGLSWAEQTIEALVPTPIEDEILSLEERPDDLVKSYEIIPMASEPEKGQDDLLKPLEPRPISTSSNRSSMHSVVKHTIRPLPSVPEPEEYEHLYTYDQEIEDYTAYTRRSMRSVGGDFTTGATTVLMAPKMTLRTQQEIMDARAYIAETRQCEELEEDEHWDISMVAEYGEEIFDYMRRLEDNMTPNPTYMAAQTELSWSMRAVLIDWIVQVHLRFGLLPETLFLCVNYIDRFLSNKVVSVGKLQLVGATAIFIAAKFEEINCPSIQEIHYMVDGGYTIEEILKAERFMLTMLDFELGWPGPMSFLRRVSKADEYDLETRTLAKYFLELTVIDERFVGCPPSYTAAGAHCLARLMLHKGGWSPAHVVYSNYTYSQLEPLLNTMISCLDDPEKHHGAVFEKYADKRFKKASTYVQEEMGKGFALPPTVQPLTIHTPCSGYFFS